MTTSAVESFLQLVFLLVIFAGILVLTYWVTKKLGQVKQGTMRHKNMQIVETISIGPTQYLHIIKVGQAYHLIATAKDHVTYCDKVDEDTLDFEAIPMKSFKEQLAQLRQTKQENDDEDTKLS